MINVLFGIDEEYAKYCATTIISILRNHKIHSEQDKIHFFFLGNLKKDSKEKLVSLKQIQPFEHTFLEVDTREFDSLPKMPAHISIAGYNRLLVTRLLPKEVNKIIYLDCDIVLNDDIDKVWEIDINNYLLAAVRDGIYVENYFNSGVMFLNLKNLRDFDFYSKWKDYVIKHPNISKLKYPDQDILNDVTKGKILFLSEYYNCRRYVPGKMIVIHYCGCKPWEILCWHDKYLKKLYWQYTDANPWKINSKINRFRGYIKSCKFLFNSSRLIMFPATRLIKQEIRHRFREKYMRKK